MGGTAVEFQRMRGECKALLLSLEQNHNIVTNIQQSSPEDELISELGKLSRVLIKKQVPKEYLRQKIQITESPLTKGLLRNIVNFLDSIY
jgi:hypothetical protein